MVVVVSSVVAVRRRLSYRVWHALHVSAYLAIALAFSHQLATGREFQGQPVARAYWWALYAVALGRSSACGWCSRSRARCATGCGSSAWCPRRRGSSRSRSAAWASSACRCARASRCTGASSRAGTGGRRTRSRCRPRPTGGGCASRSRTSATTRAGSRSLPAGTRVIIEGPSGGLTSAARRHPRVALIAGGWASRRSARCSRTRRASRATSPSSTARRSEDDVLFRAELDELARRRGAELHYVLGERRGDELLSAEHLQALVPDIAGRDVYVCGPPRMTEATRASLRRAGVSARPHHQRGVRLVNGRARRAARRARRGGDRGGRRAAGQRPRTAAVDRGAGRRGRRCRRSTRRPPSAQVRRVSSRRPTRKGPVRTGHRDGDHAVLDHPAPRDAHRRRADPRGDPRAERRQRPHRGDQRPRRADPARGGAEGGLSADIDVVSGATYTSRSYRKSLQAAIDQARARG